MWARIPNIQSVPAYANEGEFEFKGELVKVEYFLGNDAEFTTPKMN